jgi:autotransporter-associated beta strand protein
VSAAASTCFATTALAPYTVQPVVIVPSDRADNAHGVAIQLAAMDAKMAAISHWYSLALGLDARLHVRPTVAVYAARPLEDFTNVSDTTWFDRAVNVADNEFAVGSASNPHLIAGAVWGGDAKALTTNDLATTGGGFAMISTFGSAGTLAHEIGHAFGLAHPAVNNPVTNHRDNDFTVMYEFTAWPTYSNNPADPSWNLRGLHAWDNNAGGRYQDSFMLSNRNGWFRDAGARQMRFDPGGAGNVAFGGSGSWQTAGIWSYQSSTTGAPPTTSEAHVTWNNAGGANGADGAVFAGGPNGTKTVTAASPVGVSSLTFVTDDYVLSGAPITLSGEAYIAAPESTATIGNPLAGMDGLYKGQGAIILTGDCTYSGTTTIGAGVLTVGFNTTTGALGPGPVVNHGELRFNRSNNVTVANDISGTGDLTKLATSTLTLNGALTYEGATTVSAGTLQLASPLATTSVVDVGTGARMRVLDSAGVLATNQLSIASTGSIDLTSAKLIVRGGDVGSASAGVYSGVAGLVQAGHHGGAWDGVGGVMTSMPDAAAGLTALGIATADQVGKSTFGGVSVGVSVSGSNVLVMYTYAGDANLDGQITGDDYSAIDFNILVAGSSGWYNGDFNYDGAVTGDDYSAIDFNILAQGAPFPTGSPIPTGSVVAVPEPSGVAALVLLIAPAALRTRRRRR